MGNKKTKSKSEKDNALTQKDLNKLQEELKSREADQAGQSNQSQFDILNNYLSTATLAEKSGLGAMLGAFIGDSVGSYLEFKRGN